MKIAEKYPNIAYLYIVSGSVFFAVNQVLFKMGSSTMTPFQMLFIRSIALFLINLNILAKIK